MIAGIQRTLARVSSASATQTLACAAATTSGRASDSRSAVARLIGNRRSVETIGAGFKRRSVSSALGDAAPILARSRGWSAWPGEGDSNGRAGGRSPALPLVGGGVDDGTVGGADRPATVA